MKNNKGLALIELIIVFAIIGVIALFVAPKFTNQIREAKMYNIIHDIKVVEDQTELLRETNISILMSWDSVDRDTIREAVRERKVYTKWGFLFDYITIRDPVYTKVDRTFIERIVSSHLPGDFFIDSKRNIYYVDKESARLDSNYFYICKTEEAETVDIVEIQINSEDQLVMIDEGNIIAGYMYDRDNIRIFEVDIENKEIVSFLGNYNLKSNDIEQVENVVLPSYYRFIDGEYITIEGGFDSPEFGAYYFKDGVKFTSVFIDGCTPVQIIPDEVVEDDIITEEPEPEPEPEPNPEPVPGPELVEPGFSLEVSFDNGIYSRGDIIVNKKRTEMKAPLLSDFEGYLPEPVLPYIPTEESIQINDDVILTQNFIDANTPGVLVINGDVEIGSNIELLDELTLYVLGDISILNDIEDNIGLTSVDRRLTIFHYGQNINIDTEIISANIFIEDGDILLDRKGKTKIYGTIISNGENVELTVQSGNIEFLGSIYAPHSNISITSNNLFIDKGFIVGNEVTLSGHYKIKQGRISNIIE